MIAARRCHSKYHQVLCRHEAEESGVMESPQNTDLPVKQPENRFRELRPEQRGVRYPRSTTTERPGSILHRPPLLGPAAERCAFKVPSARFFLCLSARPSVLSSRVLSGLSSLGRESQMHSHSDLPLGAV